MANDGGLVAKLEQWFADVLAAIKVDGIDIFKTVDVWKHQVGASAGGIEAFTRYSPFAFVARQDIDTAREGDYDLRQIIDFRILIGVESVLPGVARIGDATHLGTSRLRELVIAALDKQHPGAGFECDEIYYTGEIEALDSPRQHAIEMSFETSFVTVPEN